MWTRISFTNLLGLLSLCCAVSTSLRSPTNVSFSSVNLRNVLHWFPGNDKPDDTHYTVEYAIYGEGIKGSKGRRVHWRGVWHCTNIIRTWCDLTTETLDEESSYHARVRATGRRSSSKWAETRRFDPKLDTTFGPPLVSLEIENNSAIITLTGPMRYPSNNHTPELMAALYPHMGYNLSIHNTYCNRMHHFPVATSLYKYHLLDYNTEYCFSAKSTFISLPVRCQASEWHCITTPQDPMIEQLQKVVVGIVVPSLCICIIMVVGYVLYNYLTGRGRKIPIILELPSFPMPPHKLPPDVFNSILPSNIRLPSNPSCPEPQLCVAPPCNGYQPQRAEEPLQPEEPGDDLSVDYGSVLVVTGSNNEEGETREMRGDKGACGNSLMGEHQKDGDSGNRQDKKDGDVIDTSQAKPYVSQSKTYTCRRVHMPMHTQREVSSLAQAHSWSQVTSAFSECENASLLPAYTAQNVENSPMCHPDQPDCLSADYNLLEPADDEEEDGQGSIFLNWNPENPELVLPQMDMWLGGSAHTGRSVNKMAEESRNLYVSRVQPQLQSVIVRQSSEEEAAMQRVLQREGDAGEVDDVLPEWGLVISINE